MSAEQRPASFLFLFIDGVGIGPDDPDTNPLAAADIPRLHALLGGRPVAGTPAREGEGEIYRPLDATLGHQGLPQSATGQTALLTGRNGAAIMDGHYGPWPGPTLRDVLRKDTLFHQAPGPARLPNVYPPGYFRAIDDGRARVNVPVFAAQQAGVPLLDLNDYRDGRGIPADLTGEFMERIDPSLAPLEPAEAGRRLAREAGAGTFTFFDLWLTDRIGHRGTFAEAVAFASRLDGFLGGVLDNLAGSTLVITSDHGNFEDKTVRTHTKHPVPLIAVGPDAGRFSACTSILDVAPAIRGAWGLPAGSA